MTFNISSWKKQLENGSIDEVLEDINALQRNSDNQNKVLLSVLTTLVTSINQKTTQLSEDTIFKLYTCILQQIQGNLSAEVKNKYLQVMYHIIYFFYDHHAFDEVLYLMSYVLPSWTPLSKQILPENDPNLITIYTNLSRLCQNSLSILITNLRVDEKLKTIEKFILTFINLNRIANRKDLFEPLAGIIETCHFRMQQHNLNRQQMYDMYIEILSTLNEIDVDETGCLPVFVVLQALILLLSLESNIKVQAYPLVQIPHATIMEEICLLFSKFKYRNAISDDVNNLIQKLPKTSLSFELFHKHLAVIILRAMKVLLSRDVNYFKHFKLKHVQEIVFEMLDIILTIGKMDSYTISVYCNCGGIECKNSISFTNSIHLLKAVFQITSTFAQQQNLLLNTDLFLKLDAALQSANTAFRKLKNTNCLKFKDIFIHFASFVFNACLNLRQNSNEMDLEIKLAFNKFLFSFYDDKLADATCNQLVQKHLISLAMAYNKSKNYQQSLEVLVVSALFFKELSTYWVNVQMSATDSTTLTVIEILQKSSTFLKSYPQLEFSLKDKIDLCLLELKLYRSVSYLKRDLLLKLTKYVIENTDNVFERGKVLQLLWDYGVADMEQYLDTTMAEYNKTFKEKINRWEENALILANLYVVKYSSIVSDNFIKQIKLFPKNDFPEIPANDDINCFEQIQDTIKYLDNALDIWLTVFNPTEGQLFISENLKNIISENNVLKIMHFVIHIYRLQKYDFNMVQTAMILYAIADRVDDFIYKQHAINILLRKNNRIELINSGMDNLQNVNENKILSAEFYLSQSYYLLKNRQYHEGYEILKKIDDNIKDIIFVVEKKVITTQYINLECYFQPDHDRILQITIENIEYLISVLKSRVKKYDVYLMDLMKLLANLFDMADFVGNLFLNLYQARPSRCYLKNILPIAYYFNLPLNYANLLLIVSRSEIIQQTEKLESNANIYKIAQILNMKDIGNSKNKSLPDVQITPELINSDDILLDIPSTITSSISVSEINFHSPDLNKFIHEPSCKCFKCTNFNYQNLIFNIISMLSNDLSQLESILNNFLSMDTYQEINFNVFEFLQPNTNEFKLQVLECYWKWLLKVMNKLYVQKDYDIILDRLKIVFHQMLDYNSLYLIPEVTDLIHSTLLAKQNQQNISQSVTPKKELNVAKAVEKSITPKLIHTTENIKKYQHKLLTPQLSGKKLKFSIYTPKTEKPTRSKKAVSPNLHDVDRLYTPYKLNEVTTSNKRKIHARKKVTFPEKIVDPDKIVDDTSAPFNNLIKSKNEKISLQIKTEQEEVIKSENAKSMNSIKAIKTSKIRVSPSVITDLTPGDVKKISEDKKPLLYEINSKQNEDLMNINIEKNAEDNLIGIEELNKKTPKRRVLKKTNGDNNDLNSKKLTETNESSEDGQILTSKGAIRKGTRSRILTSATDNNTTLKQIVKEGTKTKEIITISKKEEFKKSWRRIVMESSSDDDTNVNLNENIKKPNVTTKESSISKIQKSSQNLKQKIEEMKATDDKHSSSSQGSVKKTSSRARTRGYADDDIEAGKRNETVNNKSASRSQMATESVAGDNYTNSDLKESVEKNHIDGEHREFQKPSSKRRVLKQSDPVKELHLKESVKEETPKSDEFVSSPKTIKKSLSRRVLKTLNADSIDSNNQMKAAEIFKSETEQAQVKMKNGDSSPKSYTGAIKKTSSHLKSVSRLKKLSEDEIVESEVQTLTEKISKIQLKENVDENTIKTRSTRTSTRKRVPIT